MLERSNFQPCDTEFGMQKVYQFRIQNSELRILFITVYEGKDSDSSMAEALQDLNAGIQAYLDENGIDYN